MTTPAEAPRDPLLPRLEDEEDEAPKAPQFSPLQKELLDSRTILVHGPVSDKMAAAITAQALVLEARDKKAPLTVWINSPGGAADSGFAIYDILRFVACPVRTIVSGLCASAGILIALAGDDGMRFSMPGSRFMLHQPSTAGHGQASDLHITAREIVKIKARYNRIVAEVAKKKAEQVDEDLSRDFWLSPIEAKEYGIVDRVLESRSDLD
ncbi:MAG: ATP-dependent Clp protease proteolytic subunit [Planctomycetota bacterium]